MEEKNRFSTLLEQLMSVAGLKNYTLARELQYDVSYISKWVSGRMLPAEKIKEKILHGISHCIVTSSDEEGQATLLTDYQVHTLEYLEAAIYDNLEAEYNYVKNLQKDLGVNVSPKTYYYAELTLAEYLDKMHHPVLRRVKSLDIMAALDIMEMGHEYRAQIIQIEHGHIFEQQVYPDVHFSMLLNLNVDEWDSIYDTIFLMNMMTNLTHIDFQIYGGKEASGRAVFAVKDDFSISGMLISSNRCMSVAVSEEVANCNALYSHVQTMCHREKLLFRKTTMQEMIQKYDYVHNLISPNPHWLIGHLTEHFLPDDLFEEIVEQLAGSQDSGINLEELRGIHCLTRSIVKESHIRVIIYESAFSALAVLDTLDFYNHNVHLTAAQRLRYMEYMLTLCEEHENLEFKMIYGQFISDFPYTANQCVFLSDVISYLRLDNNMQQNNLVIVNRPEIQAVFDRFYEKVWDQCEDIVISDRPVINTYIRHVMQGIHLMSRLEGK